MAYLATTPQLGVVTMTSTSTLAPGYMNVRDGTGSGQWPQLGSTVDAYDQLLGGGKFIYLKGATGITAGIVVNWSNVYVAAAIPSTAKLGTPYAVAVSTVNATSYGWFQIGGKCSVLKTAVKISPASLVYISGTAGRFFATVTSGKLLHGAITANSATIASATSTVVVMLPPSGAFAQGYGTI